MVVSSRISFLFRQARTTCPAQTGIAWAARAEHGTSACSSLDASITCECLLSISSLVERENYLVKTYRTIYISLCEYELEVQQRHGAADDSGGSRMRRLAAGKRSSDGRVQRARTHGMRAQPSRRPAGRTGVGRRSAAGPMQRLSARAQNVLKELAVELTGEQPPKGAWASAAMSCCSKADGRSILRLARNCGPHTTREIIAWAGARGVHIEPLPRTSKSLSADWEELVGQCVERKIDQGRNHRRRWKDRSGAGVPAFRSPSRSFL